MMILDATGRERIEGLRSLSTSCEGFDGMVNKLGKVKVIITHPGRAHMDDMLSAAVACSLVNRAGGEIAPVLRKIPTPAEITDPECLLLDIGQVSSPELMTFDHHHLSEDAGDTCALKEFITAMGLWEAFILTHPWAERVVIIDACGPNEFGERFGIPAETMVKMTSPSDKALLSLMASSSSISLESFLYSALGVLGEFILNTLLDFGCTIEDIKENAEEMVTPGGIRGVLYRDTASSPSFPPASRFLAIRRGWDFCVSRDDRGVGWSIYRFSESSGLDLSRAKEHPGVSFAHKRGFLAKTNSIMVDISSVIDRCAEAAMSRSQGMITG